MAEKIQFSNTQSSDSDSGKFTTQGALDPKKQIANDVTEFNLDGTLMAAHLDHSNPFSDPAVAEHYRELHENSKYESRGAFDPKLERTKEEERKFVRKLDWYICLWAVSGSSFSSRSRTHQR